jgi:hypothetical protein
MFTLDNFLEAFGFLRFFGFRPGKEFPSTGGFGKNCRTLLFRMDAPQLSKEG